MERLIACVKASANRVVLLLGLAWMNRKWLPFGGEGVPFFDEILDLLAVDRATLLCSRRTCLVKRFSSWNLKRCWPEPTQGSFKRRHRPQVG